MKKAIIVTGGREVFPGRDSERIVAQMCAKHGIQVLAHGGASGVDSWAGEVGRRIGLDVREFRADWELYKMNPGKNPAGAIRNREMLAAVKPEFVLAFPGGTGTLDMAMVAHKANVPVIFVGPENSEVRLKFMQQVNDRQISMFDT